MEAAVYSAKGGIVRLISIVNIQPYALVRISVLNEVSFDDGRNVTHGDLTIGSVIGALEDHLVLDGDGEGDRRSVG